MSNSTTALVIAIDAEQRAQCAAVTASPQLTTTRGQQDYANCILLLHPNHIDPASAIALKITIVASFLLSCIGIGWGFSRPDDRGFMALFGAFCGALLPWVVFIILAMITIGAQFVFS